MDDEYDFDPGEIATLPELDDYADDPGGEEAEPSQPDSPEPSQLPQEAAEPPSNDWFDLPEPAQPKTTEQPKEESKDWFDLPESKVEATEPPKVEAPKAEAKDDWFDLPGPSELPVSATNEGKGGAFQADEYAEGLFAGKVPTKSGRPLYQPPRQGQRDDYYYSEMDKDQPAFVPVPPPSTSFIKQFIKDEADLTDIKKSYQAKNPDKEFDEDAFGQAVADRMQSLALKSALDRATGGSAAETAASYIPFMRTAQSITETRDVAHARKAVEEGSASQDEYDTVANAIVKKELNAKKGRLAEFLEGVASLPATLTEYGAMGLGAHALVEGTAQAANVMEGGGTPADAARAFGQTALTDAAFKAVGGVPGLTGGSGWRGAVAGTLEGYSASQTAQELGQLFTFNDKGGLGTALLRGDRKGIEDALMELAVFATAEGAVKGGKAIEARFGQLRSEGVDPRSKQMQDELGKSLRDQFMQSKVDAELRRGQPEQSAIAARETPALEGRGQPSLPGADPRALPPVDKPPSVGPPALTGAPELKALPASETSSEIRSEIASLQNQGIPRPQVDETVRAGEAEGNTQADGIARQGEGNQGGLQRLNADEVGEYLRLSASADYAETNGRSLTKKAQARLDELEAKLDIDPLVSRGVGGTKGETYAEQGIKKGINPQTGRPYSRQGMQQAAAKQGIPEAELNERRARAERLRGTPDVGPVVESETATKSPNILYGGFPVPKAVMDWTFTNRPRQAEPPVTIDQTHRLPDLQEIGEQKIIATTPRGMGLAGGLGKMFDPRSRADTPDKQANIARAAALTQGESIANTEVAKLKGKYGNIFPVVKKMMPSSTGGTFKAEVIKLTDGTFGFKGDIIEAELRSPGSQKITDLERQWINEEWDAVRADSERLLNKEGAGLQDENGPIQLSKDYFHRPAYGAEGVESAPKSGAKPGSKQAFQKGRSFETEAAGQEAGIKYEPDVNNIIGKFIKDTYRAAIDHRLANDPALAGKPVAQKTIGDVHGPNAPAFAGKVFAPEVGKELKKQYGEDVPQWVNFVNEVSQAAKSTLLGFDAAVGQLQLLPTLFTNPKAWGTAQWGFAKDLFTNKDSLQTYLQRPENYKAARELAMTSSAVGSRPDFASGSAEGAWATKIPILGKAVEHVGEATGNAFTIAKIEMWKSLTQDAPGTTGTINKKFGPEKWSEVSEAIDNLTGVGRSKAIGVSDNARIAENLLAIGPSYYRSFVNATTGATQKGVAGHLYRKQIGAFLAGTHALAVAGMLAVGLSWDEIGERLIPGTGKHLSVPITLSDGKVIEVGFGGMYMAVANLAGRIIRRPDKAEDAMLGFARNRQGFMPRIFSEVLSGKDWQGNPQTVTQGIANQFVPTAMQGLKQEGSPAQRAASAAADFMGLKNHPQSRTDAKIASLNKESQKQFNKSYDNLSMQEQRKVAAAMEKVPKTPTPATAIARGIEAQQERVKALQGTLSKSSQERLAAVGKSLPRYDRDIRLSGVDVPLTRKQMDRFEKLLVEEYNQAIAKWPMDRLEKHPNREDYVRDALTAAKQRAQKRLVQEFNR